MIKFLKSALNKSKAIYSMLPTEIIEKIQEKWWWNTKELSNRPIKKHILATHSNKEHTAFDQVDEISPFNK